jgi:DNA-binding CsgD family transcriptional regulator
MYIDKHLTFEETKNEMAAKLFRLDQKCKNDIISITESGDLFPVGVLINNRNGENLYMNVLSEETLGYAAEEARELGMDYAKAIHYNEKEAKETLCQIEDFFKLQDDTQVLAQFQRLCPKHRKDYEWIYIASKLIREHPNEPADKRLLVAVPVNLMGNLNQKFARVLDENMFMKKNFNRFAALTKREKEILSLVATGKESKCIAEELYISRHTVEQHRKNITKKVEHRNFAELIRFAMAFDLV